ncbi:hypothetical protein [Tenacibaculum sp. SDUM215027]|uniref:hypothetical protein n=1 Tax=Tenacibaculum sp. SDUM215027 TaxID=3422596 RepID=UPI003D322BF8
MKTNTLLYLLLFFSSFIYSQEIEEVIYTKEEINSEPEEIVTYYSLKEALKTPKKSKSFAN